jgi:hypothetical protein
MSVNHIGPPFLENAADPIGRQGMSPRPSTPAGNHTAGFAGHLGIEGVGKKQNLMPTPGEPSQHVSVVDRTTVTNKNDAHGYPQGVFSFSRNSTVL